MNYSNQLSFNNKKSQLYFQGATEVGQAEKVAQVIEECGGLDKIEHLQSHENNTVYNKAYNLIDTYFDDEVRILFISIDLQ